MELLANPFSLNSRSMKRGHWFLTPVFAVFLFGCGDSVELMDDAATTNPELLPARDGYRENCAVCHGKNGQGTPSLFPPLAGSEWLEGDPEAAIRVVLNGLDGPLAVRKERFLNTMAPLGKKLNDKEIAQILTYVRASWGNIGTPVSESRVQETRAATSGRKKAWTERELRSLLTPGKETDGSGGGSDPE